MTAKCPLIHVGCAADSRYAIPMAAMIFSAAIHVPASTSISFHIIDGGLLPRQRDRMNSMLSRIDRRHQIFWYSGNDAQLATLPETSRFPRQIFLRLLAPALLPANVEKLIWLDSDTVVEGDLTELWNVALDDSIIGAVLEYGVTCVGDLYDREICQQHTMMNPAMPYFNSGVLLIDLTAWRQLAFAETLFQYINRFKDTIRFPDQDALNASSAGRWKELDRRWNVQMAAMLLFVRLPREKRPVWYRQHARRLLNDPGIIHYGTAKPWNSAFFNSQRRLYFIYVRRSKMLTRIKYVRYRIASVIDTIKPAWQRFLGKAS